MKSVYSFARRRDTIEEIWHLLYGNTMRMFIEYLFGLKQ